MDGVEVQVEEENMGLQSSEDVQHLTYTHTHTHTHAHIQIILSFFQSNKIFKTI